MPSTPQTFNQQSPDILPEKEKTTSDLTSPQYLDLNIEAQTQTPKNLIEDSRTDKVSAFKSLGLLDRFLAVWILLGMAIGIILGNFVPNTGPALQKGKFVGVSIPIGEMP
jgi:ACR3 family arsenite transporter